MTTLEEHQSANYTRLVWIGNSGAGKTGGLAPLVKAGYKLHIVDLDNGLDALVNHVKEIDPKLLANVDYETVRDKFKFTKLGPQLVGGPKAFWRAGCLCDEWIDGTSPAEWGPDHVFVIDSLTSLGRAAYTLAKAQNPTCQDKRQWYQSGQELLETFIAGLTREDFKTNVIVISHIDIRRLPTGEIKGYVMALGEALGSQIPRYFNTIVLSECVGSGDNVRRMVKTVPTSLIDLKNPAPMRLEAKYPLETAMATIFEKLKEK